MERVTNWLTQRSTILGIASAAIAVIGILVVDERIDPIWSPIGSAVVSAFGLKISDKQIKK